MQRVVQGAEIAEIGDLLPTPFGLRRPQVRLLDEDPVRAPRVLAGVAGSRPQLTKHFAGNGPTLRLAGSRPHPPLCSTAGIEIHSLQVEVHELDHGLPLAQALAELA